MPKIPPLTASKLDGTSYERRPDVEACIAEVLRRPQQEWAEIAPQLPDEALVFVIRQVDKKDGTLVGALIRELDRRILKVARRWAKGFSPVTTEEILLAIELKVIELVFADKPSRRSEYLEIAFAHAIKGKTLNEVVAHKNRPTSINRAQEDGAEPQEPIDNRSGPLEKLLKVENDGLVRRALAAVPDERHREAVLLRHVEGWPLTTSDPAKPSLERHFGMSGRQIQNWINSALETMRSEIEGKI